jgi:hypothetical protein
VLEAMFILLEFPFPSRRIFIGSHSLPPLWFAVSVLHLVDAFHVLKLLSQQLLPFGRSGNGLKVLTFEFEQFSALSARHGQSTSVWRTVRGLAVRRVFFVFLLAFVFDPM